jgi:hypothetical protein
MPIVGGVKQFPTGDYTAIRVFGERCKFENGCSFGDEMKFLERLYMEKEPMKNTQPLSDAEYAQFIAPHFIVAFDCMFKVRHFNDTNYVNVELERYFNECELSETDRRVAIEMARQVHAEMITQAAKIRVAILLEKGAA